jgi:hypothetical protein
MEARIAAHPPTASARTAAMRLIQSRELIWGHEVRVLEVVTVNPGGPTSEAGRKQATDRTALRTLYFLAEPLALLAHHMGENAARGGQLKSSRRIVSRTAEPIETPSAIVAYTTMKGSPPVSLRS